MRRRDVLAMLSASAIAVAPVVRAQKPALPVVGYLSSGSGTTWARRSTAFRKGLAEASYTDGENVTIEFRWAEAQYDRLPALAADLLRRNPSVLVAGGGGIVALAAKQATSTVPVVFAIGGDPVELGLAASLNRPGGNMTGVTLRMIELEAKLLSLAHELVPKAATGGILWNPGARRFAESYVKAAQQAERTFGMEFHVVNASTDREIDEAFAALAKLRAGVLVVGADPLFEISRDRVVALAARQGLPVLYFERDFVLAGGLASYGADLNEANRQVGVYVGNILAGAKPADMPIVQLTKVELVINLKTAKTLGLMIPQPLRLRADEIIQ